MRREPTPFEEKLWLALRAKRFNGAKFRQQVVIDRYIVDFACRSPRMLVIEVDGDTHAMQPDYDARRTAFLEARGYETLRFTNGDVATNFEGVLMTIADALNLPPSPSASFGRSLLSPEGEME
jgi:very-short-patch-repair endonuclease